MQKTILIFSLAYKFTLKYIKEYLLLLLKPFIIAVVGLALMFLIQLDPLFALLGLFVTIPCICYSFWRMYVITYAVNDAAYNFLKRSENVSISNSLVSNKNKEKDLALFVSFAGILLLLAYIPTFLFIVKNLDISKLLLDYSNFELPVKMCVVVIINTILLLPIMQFFNQAFYFRKEKENYFKIILNCYKNLDMTAIIIIIFSCLINLLFSKINMFLSSFLTLIVNIFIFAINTFWFSKNKNK